MTRAGRKVQVQFVLTAMLVPCHGYRFLSLGHQSCGQIEARFLMEGKKGSQRRALSCGVGQGGTSTRVGWVGDL